MQNNEIDIFLKNNLLKPVLSSWKASIFFVISAHYIILLILPFIFSFFIKITSLYIILSYYTIILMFRGLLLLSFYIVSYIFFLLFIKHAQ